MPLDGPTARLAPAGAALLGMLVLAGPAHAAPKLFPTDAQTVRDKAQVTGRRVDLPLPSCTRRPSDCDDVRLENRLDGFDVDPRITVRFDRPIAVGDVSRRTLYLQRAAGGAGGRRIGVNRLVYDSATRTLAARPTRQLVQATRYRLVVRLGRQRATTTFTTMSTTAQTAAMAALPQKRPSVLKVTDRFAAADITGLRLHTDTGTGFADSVVLDLARAAGGTYAFGSFRAREYLRADRTFTPAPTERLPKQQAWERIGVDMIVPSGRAPRTGWPVAVFGHGFTRSVVDLFLAARENARRGLATLAINIPGAGGGPRSRLLVDTRDGRTTDLPAYGRGVDVNRDGTIDVVEGLTAPLPPNPSASVASRDVLRQAALDDAALIAAVRRGVDVDGDGKADLSRTRVGYYGQSFGGIYGAMLLALDPGSRPGVLNVAGGPISDVALLGSFRPLLTAQLGARRPSLLNRGRGGFTEAEPLYGQAPVVDPPAGAEAIQGVLAATRWIGRSGSPEAYAPGLRGDDRVALQLAFGDQTVPNPTSATLIRAGDLRERTVLYRNDRTTAAARNPHGFLLDPTFPGSDPAVHQAVDVLLGGRLRDPDGAGDIWQRAPRVSLLDRLNFTEGAG